jgi:hypothetical protein
MKVVLTSNAYLLSIQNRYRLEQRKLSKCFKDQQFKICWYTLQIFFPYFIIVWWATWLWPNLVKGLWHRSRYVSPFFACFWEARLALSTLCMLNRFQLSVLRCTWFSGPRSRPQKVSAGNREEIQSQKKCVVTANCLCLSKWWPAFGLRIMSFHLEGLGGLANKVHAIHVDRCDRTAQINSILLPKPLLLAIKQ